MTRVTFEIKMYIINLHINVKSENFAKLTRRDKED